MDGKSSRERSCVSDVSDDLTCIGPTVQTENCELHCESNPPTNQTCDPSKFPKNVEVKGFPCKYHFLPAKDWNEAQEDCSDSFDGKLWEPANSMEYSAVIDAAEERVDTKLGVCSWWLGLFNWNYWGVPENIDTYLSSSVITPTSFVAPNHNEPYEGPNGVISNFIRVEDGKDGGAENCVHTTLHWLSWRDKSCLHNLPYICQECAHPCSCNFNGMSFPCGSIIKTKPHCCSNLICDHEGTVVDGEILGD